MPGRPRFEAYDDHQDATPQELGPGAPPTAAAPAAYPPAAPPAGPAPSPEPAVPTAPALPAPQPPPPSAQAPPPQPPPAGAAQPPPTAPDREGLAGGSYVSPQLAALARAEPPPTVMPPRPPQGADYDFQELLASTPARPPLREPPEPARRAPPPPERRTVAPGSQSRARARVEKSLMRYGVSEGFARELIDAACAHTLPLAPRAGLAQAVLTTLARRIPVAPPLPLRGAAIVLVGPGGSGKTTCCATLLGAYRAGSTLPARYASLHVSADTEQLQMLLNPQIVKPTPAGSARARSALRKARREGIAILDTPAVSPAERTRVRDLARLLAELEPERVVVALPATLGADGRRAAAERARAAACRRARRDPCRRDRSDRGGRRGGVPPSARAGVHAGAGASRRLAAAPRGSGRPGREDVAMKFGRSKAPASQAVALPGRGETVSLEHDRRRADPRTRGGERGRLAAGRDHRSDRGDDGGATPGAGARIPQPARPGAPEGELLDGGPRRPRPGAVDGAPLARGAAGTRLRPDRRRPAGDRLRGRRPDAELHRGHLRAAGSSWPARTR